VVHDIELICLSLALNKGRVRVLHQMPGRIRLGLKADPTARLLEHSHIQRAEFNPITGSLLIHYTGSEIQLLKHLYQVLPDRPPAQGPPRIQKPLKQAYQTVDHGLRRLSGNWLDLRTALGLGVALYALRKKGRGPYLLWSYTTLQ